LQFHHKWFNICEDKRKPPSSYSMVHLSTPGNHPLTSQLSSCNMPGSYPVSQCPAHQELWVSTVMSSVPRPGVFVCCCPLYKEHTIAPVEQDRTSRRSNSVLQGKWSTVLSHCVQGSGDSQSLLPCCFFSISMKLNNKTQECNQYTDIDLLNEYNAFLTAVKTARYLFYYILM